MNVYASIDGISCCLIGSYASIGEAIENHPDLGRAIWWSDEESDSGELTEGARPEWVDVR